MDSSSSVAGSRHSGPLGSFSFNYSATGNRLAQLDGGTNAPIYSYQYDQANRLTSFTKHSTNEVSSYSYNGDGLRLTKPYPGNLTLEMTWDVAAGLPLLLYDGNAAYIYGPGGMLLAQAVEGINGPGAPAERSEAALTPEPLAHRYYLADQLGNVIALMDPTQGSVLDSYSYDAYGRRNCSPCGWYNPFGYAGQYGDEESGLVYMRARYYDPATQQFISRDPLGGSQPYVYAGGSPVNATDAHGMFPDWIIDAGFIALDIMDIQQNGLNWGNGLALAADLILAPTPVVPAGVGLIMRGARSAKHGDDAVRAFAHGTSPEHAAAIMNKGLDEAAGRALTRGGRLSRPGAFHTFEIGPPGSVGEGLQLAAEMGLRHSATPHVVVMKLPEPIFLDLVQRKLVAVEALPGIPVPQTVFLPKSFSTINKHASWEVAKP